MTASSHADGVLRGTTTLIGIDDTDNKHSPGTGYLAQRLLETLVADGMAEALGATRHQLLKDDRVPYTTHNSSACLAVRLTDGHGTDDVAAAAAAFLGEFAAEGSDPGLAVAPADLSGDQREALLAHGFAAKRDLLTQGAAYDAARAAGVHLSGHGGTEDGVIGALAAVGLHLSGSDGFFIWLEHLRGVRAGGTKFADLMAQIGVDDARTADGLRPESDEVIRVAPWVRPLWLEHLSVLLLELGATDEGEQIWHTASRVVVRGY